jgi:2-amino-4-hydroxy-6-hydroxymethyldihydropteridine diphosphokinase
MHVTYIGLGSNLGDRLANLGAAIAAMEPEVHPLECSSVYETPPWGYLEQPDFLNQVVKAETELSPADLLSYLKGIEDDLGRQETFLNGPRKIDLDIIFFDDAVIDSPPITIPHPRMESRGFVLQPLADLAPDLKHPVLDVSVQELLARIEVLGIEWFSPGGCGQGIEQIG